MAEKEVEGFRCPSCGVPLNVLIGKEAYKDESAAKIPRTAEAVRRALPTGVVDDLTIVEKESAYHLTPKKFLGKENFAKIMQVVNRLHGEWVSQRARAHPYFSASFNDASFSVEVVYRSLSTPSSLAFSISSRVSTWAYPFPLKSGCTRKPSIQPVRPPSTSLRLAIATSLSSASTP